VYTITTPTGRSFTVPTQELDALLRELYFGRCRDCVFAPQRHALARDALAAIADGHDAKEEACVTLAGAHA
jgi:hypothetical protein